MGKGIRIYLKRLIFNVICEVTSYSMDILIFLLNGIKFNVKIFRLYHKHSSPIIDSGLFKLTSES